jgi:hypothetical protein
MARIRTIKPEFFRHEGLFEAERECKLPLRVAFAGLWTVADREGRFKWKPRAIKLDCLPFDNVDFADVLEALYQHGFILKYEFDGEIYGCIPNWAKHQVINVREAKSTIPACENENQVHAHERTLPSVHVNKGINITPAVRELVFARDGCRCLRCGSTQDLTVDHIFPQSIGGTHALNNLRCLCRLCNSARPVAGVALIEDLKKDGFTLDDMSRICMHVHARGEGKGKERKGIGKEGNGKEKEQGYSEEFLEFWEAYPRKDGSKREAFVSFTKAVKTGVSHETITRGSREYANHVTRDGTEQKFVKHAQTWLNQRCWESDYTTSKSTIPRGKGYQAATAGAKALAMLNERDNTIDATSCWNEQGRTR